MWQRIKTAIILVTIVGICMFAFESAYPFLLLLMVGISIAVVEWQAFVPHNQITIQQDSTSNTNPSNTNPSDHQNSDTTETNQDSDNRQKLSLASVLLYCVPMFGVLLILTSIKIWAVVWGIAVLACLIASSWIVNFPKKITWFDQRVAIMGIILLTATMTGMYALWSLSPWWLMYVFVLVWAADSGAYFVGRKLGKRKMAPNVSPNKSVEGLMGGIVTGLLIVGGVSFYKLDYQGMDLVLFIALSVVTIVSSVFGDLFESMMKRQVNIKDSGTILPGHGGVLDRIDSLLFAVPVFACGFYILGGFGI